MIPRAKIYESVRILNIFSMTQCAQKSDHLRAESTPQLFLHWLGIQYVEFHFVHAEHLLNEDLEIAFT